MYILRLGLILDCARYNDDFVISRFCSIHFTVTLAGLKNRGISKYKYLNSNGSSTTFPVCEKE